jgi:hypothetical protein
MEASVADSDQTLVTVGLHSTCEASESTLRYLQPSPGADVAGMCAVPAQMWRAVPVLGEKAAHGVWLIQVAELMRHRNAQAGTREYDSDRGLREHPLVAVLAVQAPAIGVLTGRSRGAHGVLTVLVVQARAAQPHGFDQATS